MEDCAEWSAGREVGGGGWNRDGGIQRRSGESDSAAGSAVLSGAFEDISELLVHLGSIQPSDTASDDGCGRVAAGDGGGNDERRLQRRRGCGDCFVAVLPAG